MRCSGHLLPENGNEIAPNSYIFFDAKVGLDTKGNLYEGLVLPPAENTSFGVFGVRSDGVTPIFNGYSKFTLSGNGNSITGGNSTFDNTAILYRNATGEPFQYDELGLWDGGANSFYAYYFNESEFSPSLTDRNKIKYIQDTYNVITGIGINETGVYMEYVQPTTLETMVDLMTANTTAYRCDPVTGEVNEEVTLDFRHRLFALDIIVRNNQTRDTESGFAAQKLTVTSATASFEVPSGGLLYFNQPDVPSSQTCPVTYPFGGFQIGTPGGSHIDTNLNLDRLDAGYVRASFLFLPCTSIKIKFVMEYINRWGEETSYTYDSIDGSDPALTVEGGFLPGHKYTFIIIKNNFGSEFEFVPKIAEIGEDGTEGSWNNKDVDHTFN